MIDKIAGDLNPDNPNSVIDHIVGTIPMDKMGTIF